MKACITYDIVTHESAEDGDTAENGWWLPGGLTFNLACEEREAVLAEARSGAYDLQLRTAVSEALSLGVSEGTFITSADNRAQLSVRTVDPDVDYSTGEETHYTLHINSMPIRSGWRVRRYLETRGVRFY